MRVGPLGMLILQPTPFCNIDCRYCYLPNRSSRARMSLDVVKASVYRALETGLVGDNLDVLWHAGEPLVAGRGFYEGTGTFLQSIQEAGQAITQILQTNGMLIDDAWCDLFRRQKVQVGVSIDGPEDLHDRYRTDRTGRGTFGKVMAGVECLKRNGIPFSAMAVLTRESLREPARVLNFFEGHDIRHLAFNIEEPETNAHTSSFTDVDDILALYDVFLKDAFARHQAGRLQIREIRHGLERRRMGGASGGIQAVPLHMVTVGHEGNFSTFCPELHDVTYADGSRHVFGNVMRDKLVDMFSNPQFAKVYDEMLRGIERCSQNCEHFGICGSQRVSVKYFTHGTFDVDETLICKAQIKQLANLLNAVN